MLTTEEYTKILYTKGDKYSFEQVKQITEFLYNKAKIALELYNELTDDEKEKI